MRGMKKFFFILSRIGYSLMEGGHLPSSMVQMLTRFQSGSENMSPMPWPSAAMRVSLILYFLTSMFFTASARAFASFSLKARLPSGEAYHLMMTLASGCLFM